jgi:hypothetical protein
MIDVLAILPGTKLKLVGSRIAEVVENMQDGQWVMVRALDAPDALRRLARRSSVMHRTSLVLFVLIL